MRDVPKRVARKGRSLSTRVVKGIIRRVDPVEREFHKLWPMVEPIEGLLVSPVQEHWLFKTARSLAEGAVIVEIGSFKGRSTCCLAYGCRNTSKHVFAIDTFAGNTVDFQKGVVFEDDFFDVFWGNIKTCGLTSYVTPIRMWSSEAVKTWDKPIDMIFIDGSHQYEDVLADFEGFFPYVKPGGIVALHDVIYTWPGSLRVWEEVASPRLSEIGSCSTLAYGKKSLSSRFQVR